MTATELLEALNDVEGWIGQGWDNEDAHLEVVILAAKERLDQLLTAEESQIVYEPTPQQMADWQDS